jgi:hypothetical protein
VILLAERPPIEPRRLGRQPRSFRQNIPHFSSMRLMYRGAELRPLPDEVHNSKGMPSSLGLMLNDHLGCCTIAGLYHARQVWRYAAAQAMEAANESFVLEMYEKICNYVDGNEATDNGGIEQHVLSYYVNNGIPTDTGLDKLLGFVEIDPRALQDIRRCIAEAGLCYIGIDIPQAWTEALPGSTWDMTNSPVVGGHCIILTGYDLVGVDLISWGLPFRMTWEAFTHACDEAYMLLDRAWIKASGLSPFDMTADQINSAMQPLKMAA